MLVKVNNEFALDRKVIREIQSRVIKFKFDSFPKGKLVRHLERILEAEEVKPAEETAEAEAEKPEEGEKPAAEAGAKEEPKEDVKKENK